MFQPLSMFCNGKRDIHNQIVLYSIPVINHYIYTQRALSWRKRHFFAKWWGNPKGLLGQMPHYATVLKNALAYPDQGDHRVPVR